MTRSLVAPPPLLPSHLDAHPSPAGHRDGSRAVVPAAARPRRPCPSPLCALLAYLATLALEALRATVRTMAAASERPVGPPDRDGGARRLAAAPLDPVRVVAAARWRGPDGIEVLVALGALLRLDGRGQPRRLDRATVAIVLARPRRAPRPRVMRAPQAGPRARHGGAPGTTAIARLAAG